MYQVRVTVILVILVILLVFHISIYPRFNFVLIKWRMEEDREGGVGVGGVTEKDERYQEDESRRGRRRRRIIPNTMKHTTAEQNKIPNNTNTSIILLPSTTRVYSLLYQCFTVLSSLEKPQPQKLITNNLHVSLLWLQSSFLSLPPFTTKPPSASPSASSTLL